ncbi:MAG: Gfo/Idh/MocA family oxidoreductase [Candidatus Aenigmarchaeota archaeon]|nr:Gfo/Idh/MocA family oxidoreductase [Candidatus Aenigmarchaeota archaeon]
MPKKSMSIGVVGAGPWGENHIRNYCTLGLDVWVADIDETRLKELEAKYPIKTTKEYKELLTNEKIRGVSICAPASMHYRIALEFISAKKHVLIEKPMALNVEDANKIMDLAKENEITVMVGHLFRYDSAINKLKEELKTGSFGKIYSIYTSRMGLKLPRNDVGATLNYAVHDIDIMCDILGDVYPEEITTITSRNLGNSNEDLAVIVARFNKDILGYCQVGWLTPKKMRDIIITGEKRSAEVDTMNNKLIIINECLEKNKEYYNIVKSAPVELSIEKKEPLKEELTDFICSIQDKTTPKASGEIGLRTIKILTAGLLSAKEKRTIKLDKMGDICV